MRPSHDPAIAKARLAFRSEPLSYDRRDLDQQRKLLADGFAAAGWHASDLISAAAEADDFYFDAFLQVHMESWSQGRVTLRGDAGYCASPLSGMGTSLALVGAYVLGGELGSADGELGPGCVTGALERYARVMRPYVDKCQLDAALAIPVVRRQEVLHHRRFHRTAGLRASHPLAGRHTVENEVTYRRLSLESVT